MKLPSVKNILRKKYADDTHGYICLRIGLPGVKIPKLKSYNYKLHISEWDDANEIVKKAHSDYVQINAEIAKEKDDISALLKAEARRGVLITGEYIDNLLNPQKARGSFLRFYDAHIELLTSRCAPGYVKHLLVEYNILKKYAGDDLSFEDITAKFLERYELSLKGTGPESKIAPTTLYVKMRRLKEVISKAIDRGLILKKNVAGYKYPKDKEPETFYITLGHTEKIWENITTGAYDFDPNVKITACFFLVECYSGIRFSDWARFEIEKLVHDRNLKVRAKKNGEPVYLSLSVFKRLAAVVDFIEANQMKFTFTEQATNRILKSIGTDLKLKFPLTTHVGRRTCGTLLGEMRYSTRAIADVLGITEATAKRYVKQTRQSLNNEQEALGGL